MRRGLVRGLRWRCGLTCHRIPGGCPGRRTPSRRSGHPGAEPGTGRGRLRQCPRQPAPPIPIAPLSGKECYCRQPNRLLRNPFSPGRGRPPFTPPGGADRAGREVARRPRRGRPHRPASWTADRSWFGAGNDHGGTIGFPLYGPAREQRSAIPESGLSGVLSGCGAHTALEVLRDKHRRFSGWGWRGVFASFIWSHIMGQK